MKIVVPERVVEAARKAGHAAQQEALRACREPFCELDHDKEFTLAALPAALQEWIASGEARISEVRARNSDKIVARRFIITLEPDND